MTLGLWLLAGAMAMFVLGVLLFALLSVSHKVGHQAKVDEKRMDPFSDVDITIT